MRLRSHDISVVCDRSKIDRHGCKGAPDLIIEILSPSTRRHDRLVKLNLYQRAGVREYWMVDPDNIITSYDVIVKTFLKILCEKFSYKQQKKALLRNKLQRKGHGKKHTTETEYAECEAKLVEMTEELEGATEYAERLAAY